MPTCSRELLRGLGQLALKYGCHVQTHASESVDQVALGMFPSPLPSIRPPLDLTYRKQSGNKTQISSVTFPSCRAWAC